MIGIDASADKSSETQRQLYRSGERGIILAALQEGYTVHIHEDDGTTTVEYYTLQDGAVLLDPDVREYFPDAKAANAALLDRPDPPTTCSPPQDSRRKTPAARR